MTQIVHVSAPRLGSTAAKVRREPLRVLHFVVSTTRAVHMHVQQTLRARHKFPSRIYKFPAKLVVQTFHERCVWVCPGRRVMTLNLSRRWTLFLSLFLFCGGVSLA